MKIGPNATIETLSLNLFFVNENMNEYNKDLDLDFFDESVSSSIDTDHLSPKDLKSKS